MKISDCIRYGKMFLKEREISSYALDAELLLMEVLGLTRVRLLCAEGDIRQEDYERYTELLVLRAKKMPVKYIIQRADFMGLDFFVNKKVLIPRSETELLVTAVIAHLEGEPPSGAPVVDICTGSGCIAIAIAHRLRVSTIGVDISHEAVEVAKKNAGLLLEDESMASFYCADLFDTSDTLAKICGRPRVIVSNPPYIPKREMDELMPDVAEYEPHIALYGGMDGLDFYRRLAEVGYTLLEHGGAMFLEIGYNQAESVANIMEQNNFEQIKVINDYAGHQRIVTAKKREKRRQLNNV